MSNGRAGRKERKPFSLKFKRAGAPANFLVNIAFLLDTFPSPTETFIARDIEALRRYGLNIQVFALHAGPGAQSMKISGSLPLFARGLWEKATRPGLRPGYFQALGAAWWRELEAAGQAKDIDHLHAGWASHPAYVAWGAAQAARPGRNLTWSFSGHARDIFVMGGDLSAKLEAACFASLCTRTAALHLQALAPQHRDKIIHAPHGVESGQIPFSARIIGAEPQLLAVGRLVQKKGFEVLLDACAVLQARDFKFTLRIIGDGPLLATLKERCRRLNLSERVHIAGALSQPEVLNSMRAASCLIVPSLVAADGDRDGLPNVLLEAAACGLPLVATRAGAIEEFVDETTGLLCAPGRAEELAAAVQSVFADRTATEQRRLAARRRVESDFDLMTNALRLADALRQSQNKDSAQ